MPQTATVIRTTSSSSTTPAQPTAATPTAIVLRSPLRTIAPAARTLLPASSGRQTAIVVSATPGAVQRAAPGMPAGPVSVPTTPATARAVPVVPARPATPSRRQRLLVNVRRVRFGVRGLGTDPWQSGGASTSSTVATGATTQPVPMDIPQAWLGALEMTAVQTAFSTFSPAAGAAVPILIQQILAAAGVAVTRYHANAIVYRAEYQAMGARLLALWNDARVPPANQAAIADALAVVNSNVRELDAQIEQLNGLRDGRSILALAGNGIAILAREEVELPGDLPSVEYEGGVGDGPLPIAAIVVVGIIVVGFAVAVWAASRAMNEPARLDADSRNKLAAAKARSMEAIQATADALIAAGNPTGAAALLREAQPWFGEDIQAFNEIERNRSAAEAGTSFAEMFKWGIGAFFLLELMKRR
jgi:hypothetical protein